MKNIRIKKDINIKWTITTNGENISLANRDLTLYLVTPYRTHLLLDYTVEDNIITTVYRGTEQKLCGKYSLTLFENKDKEGQTVVDKISAFKLVENTDKEIDDIIDNLQIETVDLGSSNLDVIINGNVGNGYTKEEIDDKLDSKADKSDIPSKVSELVNDSGYLTEHQDISHLATKDEIPDVSEYITETELNAKGYATKTELGNKLDTLIYNSDKENFATKTELSNYYTKQEIDNIQIWDCGEY